MANSVYPAWKELVGKHGIGDSQSAPTGDLSLVLVTASYTYNDAHDFMDDLGANIVDKAVLSNPTWIGKTLDADDAEFPAITGAPVAAAVVAMDTGTDSTSRLIAFIDTGITGLPFTPSGADATLAFDAAGIFDL